MNIHAKPYGPVMQVAYVVDDLQAAIDHWTTVIGVGPFLVLDGLQFTNGHYLGQPLDLQMTAAMAYSDGLQIELIKQHDQAPTLFTQRRPAKGGVHHVAAMTDDLDASLAYLQARGGSCLQGAQIPGGGRVAYVEVGGDAGILELAELTPATLALFDLIRSAAQTWDGQQQIMNLPS
ncbi:VOC family protein [Pseudomonas umsongensis]|uniref:VOC family protein n=1 Tax=Pseudomonas umsongensis TaxID=198618 RepID=UPI00200B2732|nr:VOC family protein [Pseudomonas umsongensis]MCK8683283.1 VOC family protein [Pseudomonas umsongensis]